MTPRWLHALLILGVLMPLFSLLLEHSQPDGLFWAMWLRMAPSRFRTSSHDRSISGGEELGSHLPGKVHARVLENRIMLKQMRQDMLVKAHPMLYHDGRLPLRVVGLVSHPP